MPRRVAWACAAAFASILSAADAQGCVGTLAGVPRHAPLDGSSAFGAQLAGIQGAAVDPSNPCNLYVALADRVLLVDCNKTISRVAGGGSNVESAVATLSTLYYPLVSAGPSGTVIIADALSIRLFDPATARLTLLAGNLITGRGWSRDGTLGSEARVSGCPQYSLGC